MTCIINYKETIFERANLTPICVKPTFEALHKLWKVIKANAKAVYSNIGGGAHVHLGLVITEFQFILISPTSFLNHTHPGPLIIQNNTTVHANSNI